MHKHHYDLERFTLGPWDDIDNIDDVPITIPPEAFAIEEAEHVLNVAIATWIEDLCQNEVGRDWLFAPDHTYASLRQDEVEGGWREQQWRVLFYERRRYHRGHRGGIRVGGATNAQREGRRHVP